MISTLLALALTTSTLTAAQTSTPSTPTTQATQATPEEKVEVRYQARTLIDFSIATVHGELDRPDGIIYKVPKKPRFRNLIELRSNFRPELASSPAGL